MFKKISILTGLILVNLIFAAAQEPDSILILSEKTSFKSRVSENVVTYVEGRGFQIEVRDLYGDLMDDYSDYRAVILMAPVANGTLNKRDWDILKKIREESRVILLETHNGDYKGQDYGVDAVSRASSYVNIDVTVSEIASFLDTLP